MSKKTVHINYLGLFFCFGFLMFFIKTSLELKQSGCIAMPMAIQYTGPDPTVCGNVAVIVCAAFLVGSIFFGLLSFKRK